MSLPTVIAVRTRSHVFAQYLLAYEQLFHKKYFKHKAPDQHRSRVMTRT